MESDQTLVYTKPKSSKTTKNNHVVESHLGLLVHGLREGEELRRHPRQLLRLPHRPRHHHDSTHVAPGCRVGPT